MDIFTYLFQTQQFTKHAQNLKQQGCPGAVNRLLDVCDPLIRNNSKHGIEEYAIFATPYVSFVLILQKLQVLLGLQVPIR